MRHFLSGNLHMENKTRLIPKSLVFFSFSGKQKDSHTGRHAHNDDSFNFVFTETCSETVGADDLTNIHHIKVEVVTITISYIDILIL